MVRPVGIVASGIETHPGSVGVNVISTPGAGAATGLPALSSRMLIELGKSGLICSNATVMFRFAWLATCALALEKFGELAVTTALPGDAPRTVPLAPNAPAGMVTVPVVTSTADELLLTSVTTRPPAGAGLGMVIGSDAVWPRATFTLAGTVRTFWVTETSNSPAA